MRILIASLLCLTLFGCSNDIVIRLDTPTVKSTSTKEVDGVYAALKDASKDDCLKVYTIFKSFSDYIKYTKNTKNTIELMERFKVARKDIGWEDNKYDSLTKFTSTNILEQKFITKVDNGIKPEDLTDDVRNNWSKLFSDYADGAKKAYLDKK